MRAAQLWSHTLYSSCPLQYHFSFYTTADKCIYLILASSFRSIIGLTGLISSSQHLFHLRLHAGYTIDDRLTLVHELTHLFKVRRDGLLSSDMALISYLSRFYFHLVGAFSSALSFFVRSFTMKSIIGRQAC